MPGPLAKLIRSKYPGQYDDMDDVSLEKAILAKYPDYADLAEEPEIEPISGVSFDPVKPEIIEPEIVEPGIPEVIQSEIPPQEPNLLQRGWNAISEPLTDIPSRFADTVANAIDNPNSKSDNSWMAALRGFGAGTIEGLGDVASSLTSPINIATLGMGTRVKGLQQIGRAASGLTAAHGGIAIANPDSTIPERLWGLVEAAGGVAGLKAKLPEIAKLVADKVPEVPISKAKSSTDIPGIEPRVNELLLKARNEQILPEEMIELRELTGAPEITETGPVRDNSPFQYEDVSAEPILTQNPDGTTSTYSRAPEPPSQTPLNQRGMVRARPDSPFTPGQQSGYTAETVASDIKYLTDKGLEVPPELQARALELGQAQGPTPDDIALDNYNRSNQQFADQVIPPNEADMINQSFNEPGIIPEQPQNFINEGTDIIDPSTGEVMDMSIPSEVREFASQPERAVAAEIPQPHPKLPKDLSGARPTFNIGPNNYTPKFQSDLDKALYIIAQKNPSKADARYLKFVMDMTGLDEAQARTAGRDVRTKLKGIIKSSAPGDVAIPSLFNSPKRLRVKISNGEFIDLDTGEAIPLNDARFKGKPQPVEIQPTPPAERLSPAEPAPPKPSIILEGMGFFKGIASSYDMSFPFRQGLGAIHTKGWWNAWGDSIKSIGEESSYQAVVESIKERPNFQSISDPTTGKVKPSFAQEAGLAITDLDHLATREENIGSKWAEKIPGIRASNRGFNAFALKVRADNFDNLIEQAERIYQTARETGKAKRGIFTESFNPTQTELLNPRTNMILAKDIARFVNASTGRGGLGKVLEPAAQALGTALFSPRFIASRLKYMDPRVYIGADPFVRKQYLKSIMAIAGAWTAVGTLGKMAGGEVNLDSNSSDFLKIKIGNTRLDPGAGFQQYLVLLSRLASQSRTSSSKESYGKNTDYGHGYKAPTWGGDLVKFIRNKFAPAASLVTDPFFADEKYPFEVGDRAIRMFAPMIVQDLSELAQEDPMLIPLLIPTGVGLGSQTYGEKEPNRFLGSMFPRRNDMMFPSR